MNHVIAKIRQRGGVKFKKICSGIELFSLPNDITSNIPYSPDHNLDDDSWFSIDSFSKKEYFLGFLAEPFKSAEYDLLTAIDVNRLDYICSYQNDNEYFFQNVVKSHLLVNKGFFRIGESICYETDQNVIPIGILPDALYNKRKDILYFKKLEAITSIFKGIDILYREATDGETQDFLSEKFVKIDEDFSADKVGKMNRRRIALAMDSLISFKVEEKKNIISYIQDYCPNLPVQDDSFVIKTDDDLKWLLFGIEQRYYTTPVHNERRCANSIIRLSQK